METSERLASVETNIENIKEDVKDIKDLLNDQMKWQEKRFKELDRKYANKWVEKILIPVIVLALATLISLFNTSLAL